MTSQIIHDIPFDEYCRIDREHFSRINCMLSCPADYAAAVRGEKKDPTKLMEGGTLFHAALLEPAKFLRDYALLPDFTEGCLTADGKVSESPRATKEYKSRVAYWQAENPGRKPVSEVQWESIARLRESLHEKLFIYDLEILATEVTCLFYTYGIEWKSRIDLLCRDSAGRHAIVDLKFPGGDSDEFRRKWWYRGYHRQGALYQKGMGLALGDTPRVFMCALEQDTGNEHHTLFAPFSAEALDQGNADIARAVHMLKDCEAFGFTGYESPAVWELPKSHKHQETWS